MPAKKTVKKVAKKVAKKVVKGSATLSPAELKKFQQKGFTKPEGFKPGR